MRAWPAFVLLLATAAALSTNNLRDARFSCSLVGDSILAGLVAGDEGGFEPVAKVVVDQLRKLILTPVDLRVSAEPLRTAGQVEVALLEELSSRRPDAVVILTGTNDLWRCDSAAIATSLTRQYEACANAGVQHVVGLTLPPFTADATRWFSFVDLPRRIEQTRLTVNEDIRRAAPVLLDLAAEADADTTYERPDGIHFTAAGLPGTWLEGRGDARGGAAGAGGAGADGDLSRPTSVMFLCGLTV